MGAARMHVDELAVSERLVRQLLARDLPQLADLQLRRLACLGSSNVLFRLGEHLLVRLPRQVGGSATIDKEARYLPWVAQRLRVAVPDIIAVGEPGFGYPERWLVVRWVDGDAPSTPVPQDALSARFAHELAVVIAELHRIEVPSGASDDPALHWYRAGSISSIDAEIRQYLEACRAIPNLGLPLDACSRFWDSAMRIPDLSADEPPRCIHADLLAENLLVRDGRLVAVLDFGGLSLGHPSVDFIAAWELLAGDDRDVVRSALSVSEVDWLRGRAWAFAIAIMTFPYYWRTLPDRCARRLVMAQAVLDDFAANG